MVVPPYIKLKDVYGSTKGDPLGWCLDVLGYGDNMNFDKIHAHDCKPNNAPDMTFALESDNIRLESFDKCLTGDLKLVNCDETHAKWIFSEKRTLNFGDKCLVVKKEIQTVGRHEKRDVALDYCEKIGKNGILLIKVGRHGHVVRTLRKIRKRLTKVSALKKLSQMSPVLMFSHQSY